MARFYWRDKAVPGLDGKGAMRQLTFEEFNAMGLSKNVTSGTLALMVTRVAVHFNVGLDGEMPLRVDKVLPTTSVVIQRTNGSNKLQRLGEH